MRKFAGALATGAIVAATLGGLVAAPALAADTKTATAPAAAPAAAPVAQAAAAPQPMKMKKPMAMAMSRKRVEEIQTALAKGGEQIAVDGIWGPKTTAAVRDFQKAHNLKVTGHLDHETLIALPKTT